jgi:hypothetical protein
MASSITYIGIGYRILLEQNLFSLRAMKNKFVIGSKLGYATEQLSNETLP